MFLYPRHVCKVLGKKMSIFGFGCHTSHWQSKVLLRTVRQKKGEGEIVCCLALPCLAKRCLEVLRIFDRALRHFSIAAERLPSHRQYSKHCLVVCFRPIDTGNKGHQMLKKLAGRLEMDLARVELGGKSR